MHRVNVGLMAAMAAGLSIGGGRWERCAPRGVRRQDRQTNDERIQEQVQALGHQIGQTKARRAARKLRNKRKH